MRVIKFRFWDKEDLQMNDWGDSCPMYTEDFEENEECIAMQFTGFLDKSDNEIYEGDIIGDWTESDGKQIQSAVTVYFDEMLGQWMVDHSYRQDRTFSSSLFSDLQDFEYEVRGNIYENPKLLINK